jgi:hypothetical protein
MATKTLADVRKAHIEGLEFELLEQVKQAAIEDWGVRWRIELTHAYYRFNLGLPKDEIDRDAYRRTHPTILKVFDRMGGCRMDTLLILYGAVGLELGAI